MSSTAAAIVIVTSDCATTVLAVTLTVRCYSLLK